VEASSKAGSSDGKTCIAPCDAYHTALKQIKYLGSDLEKDALSEFDQVSGPPPAAQEAWKILKYQIMLIKGDICTLLY
jgi:hypothetical protein